MLDQPTFDFSSLSPAERLELAQRLWESVDEAQVDWTLTPAQRAELVSHGTVVRAELETGSSSKTE